MSTRRGGDRSHDRWVKRIRHSPPGEVVMSRGIIHGNGCSIEYYTSQPSAAQWIALGVMPLLGGIDQEDATHRVVVGTGQSEHEAITSLKARVDELFAARVAVPVGDPMHLDLQPSDWFG